MNGVNVTKTVKKLINGSVYIDSSDLNSIYMGDIIYSGTVRLIVEPQDKPAYLAKVLIYNPDKPCDTTEPESDVGHFIAIDLGMLDDSFHYWAYGYGEPDEDEDFGAGEFGAEFTCLTPYWRATVKNSNIINKNFSISLIRGKSNLHYILYIIWNGLQPKSWAYYLRMNFLLCKNGFEVVILLDIELVEAGMQIEH